LAERELASPTAAQVLNRVAEAAAAQEVLLITAELAVHQISQDRLLHVVAEAVAEQVLMPPALVAVAVAANRGG